MRACERVSVQEEKRKTDRGVRKKRRNARGWRFDWEALTESVMCTVKRAPRLSVRRVPFFSFFYIIKPEVCTTRKGPWSLVCLSSAQDGSSVIMIAPCNKLGDLTSTS